MPQQTPILDLTLFDGIDDKPESFLSYRTAIAGTEPSSNFNKIDVAIGELQEDVELHKETIKGITGEEDVETEPETNLKEAKENIDNLMDDSEVHKNAIKGITGEENVDDEPVINLKDTSENLQELRNDVDEINSEIHEPDFNTIELTALEQIKSVTDSYGGVAEFIASGTTLFQAVENGDFSNGGSNLATGWSISSGTAIRIQENGIWFQKVTSPSSSAWLSSTGITFDMIQGQKYYVGFLGKGSGSAWQLRMRNLDGTEISFSVTFNNVNLDRLNYIVTSSITDTCLLEFRHITADIDVSAQIGMLYIIPITGTPYESLTAEEINARIGTYWEGLKSTEEIEVASKDSEDNITSKVKITCTDKEKFDLAELPNGVSNTIQYG